MASASHIRGFIRTAVLAVALPVLAFGVYVGSYLARHWGICNGVPGWERLQDCSAVVYEPLDSYRHSGRPGAGWLEYALLWTSPPLIDGRADGTISGKYPVSLVETRSTKP